jgi:hypothetical protein
VLSRISAGIAVVAAALFLTGCEVMGPSGPSGPPPDALGAEIVEQRESGTRRADRALAQAARLLGGKVVGRASNDQCWEGQRNWKRDDGYDYRCAARRVVVVGFDGDFRKRMKHFDARLFASGWQCDRFFECHSNSQYVQEYWAMRRAERVKGQPFPIWKLPTKTDGYERGEVRLFVDYASTVPRSTSALEFATLIGRSGLGVFHDDERPLAVPDVVTSGKPYPYLVVLATEIDYFTQE